MRIYRWCLRLAPVAVRREYGAAMEEAFARRLDDARRAGVRPVVRLCRREIGGLLALAVSERWRAARVRGRRRAQTREKAGAMDLIRQEIWHAARRLVRAPAFTAPAVLTLALAVGANVSIFAVVQRVLLNPLPYPDSARIVALDFAMPSRNVSRIFFIPERIYRHYLDRARALDAVAVHRSAEVTLAGGDGAPERIRVARTTASLASVLRVRPAEGRWFAAGEDLPGAAPVTVISHGLWVRRYGRAPGVVGRVVNLDGVPTTIVGVMPASFAFPDARVDLWLGAPFFPATETDAYALAALARLRPGVTLSGARAELTRLAVELDGSYPRNGYRALVSIATPLIEATVGRVSNMLWVLLASVGLVLLVACANVANLFLVRSELRQKEMAVRNALGASRRAITRYLLTESTLLCVVGSAVGLGLAFAAVRMLAVFGPANLPRLEEIRIDGVVLAFTIGLAFVTAAVFGAVPFLRRAPIVAGLHEGGRGNSATRRRHRARHVLMAGQVALALVLLIASGLMLRSFQKLRSVDPGFDARSTLTFHIGLPRADYPARAAMAAAHRAVLDRLSGAPGVSAASAVTCLPLSERQLCQGGPLFIEDRPLAEGSIAPFVAVRGVAGGYFETMRMRLRSGRGIERGDVEREALVAVVNQALVTTAFGGENPVGKRIRMGNPALAGSTPDWLTVVGVVADTPTFSLAEPSAFPQLFTPIFASRPVNLAPRLDTMSFVIRATARPEALVAEVRRAVRAVDANLAIAQLQTLQDVLDRSSAEMAFTMILLAISAMVALTLGVIGVYGVMSYIVTQRTGEIGVRLTLGAKPGSIAAAIVNQGGRAALAGVAAGFAIAFAAGNVVQSLLYGVSPRDPSVFAATTTLLLVVALFACWVPARRASRLNPVEALRAE
jgi:putative ABC transport system permease protein